MNQFSLALQLAWRFRTNKHQSGFVSFISASSTIGIALGCFVFDFASIGYERLRKGVEKSTFVSNSSW